MIIFKRISVFLTIFVLLGLCACSSSDGVSQEGDVWFIENSHLKVTIQPTGVLNVYDKKGNREWQQVASKEKKIENVSEVSTADKWAIAFETEVNNYPFLIKLSLPKASADLEIEADMENRDTPIEDIPFFDPFLLDSEHCSIAVADFCNGHLYPADLHPFPYKRYTTALLDMPWIGVCDAKEGHGYEIILDTSDDAFFDMIPVKVGKREIVLPKAGWISSKKRFGYARRLLCHFVSDGGYVALAKYYRTYAQKRGLIVPFSEKVKKNPNLTRLFGAVDVWGQQSVEFAKEAKKAGVEKMIMNGNSTPEELKSINELGYLTSCYDAYQDVFQIEADGKIDSGHEYLPDNIVLKDDSTRMLAWCTWDGHQSMKRCPVFWERTAKLVIPEVLSKYPFLCRFIDVTTAEDLYECYDERHPLTRAEKRELGVRLFDYIRSQGLVVGGEHGRWWAAPVIDYVEGMMSGGTDNYAWDAPYLRPPMNKEGNKWEQYETLGMNPQYRVPLWELVFHDCVVSTWYWGDANDFLTLADPKFTDMKNCYNILYGTIPLLWANEETGGAGPAKPGSWVANRELFLETYRNVCKLHEVIAGQEMTVHEFLTLDGMVQRTCFADGTEVVVNFGESVYEATVGGKKYQLPQYGFAVKGPKIEQSRALIDGQIVTNIHTNTYNFQDFKQCNN